MKRWGLLVTAFYLVVLTVLSLPVTYAAFWEPETSIYDMLGMYQEWIFWIWIGIMVCGEALLLFVPVRYTTRRLKSRRPLLVPIITSGFFLGILLFSGLLSISGGIWGDDGPTFPLCVPEEVIYISFCAIPIIFWIAWSIIFYQKTKSDDPDTLIKRITSWMIKGSYKKAPSFHIYPCSGFRPVFLLLRACGVLFLLADQFLSRIPYTLGLLRPRGRLIRHNRLLPLYRRDSILRKVLSWLSLWGGINLHPAGRRKGGRGW